MVCKFCASEVSESGDNSIILLNDNVTTVHFDCLLKFENSLTVMSINKSPNPINIPEMDQVFETRYYSERLA